MKREEKTSYERRIKPDGCNKMKIKLSEKGFTLTEIIITVAMIAIIASIAAPNFYSSDYKVKSVTNDIYSTMQLARLNAVSKKVEFRVVFNLANQSYKLQRGNFANNSTIWTDETEVINLPPSVNIATGPANQEFNPDGTSTTASINIQNTKGKKYKMTILAATGRIKKASGWDW
jgi:prepilin-type N-terminal cleavage/methylation domain-containing protein